MFDRHHLFFFYIVLFFCSNVLFSLFQVNVRFFFCSLFVFKSSFFFCCRQLNLSTKKSGCCSFLLWSWVVCVIPHLIYFLFLEGKKKKRSCFLGYKSASFVNFATKSVFNNYSQNNFCFFLFCKIQSLENKKTNTKSPLMCNWAFFLTQTKFNDFSLTFPLKGKKKTTSSLMKGLLWFTILWASVGAVWWEKQKKNSVLSPSNPEKPKELPEWFFFEQLFFLLLWTKKLASTHSV